MRVAILDDYADTLRTLRCFSLLDGHDVTVFTDHCDDADELAMRLAGTEALVLIRERTALRAELLERLGDLRLVSLRSAFPHVDVETCTRLGIVVSSNLHSDTPSYAASEMTFALILAAARRLPAQAASLREGRWQTEVGRTLRGSTLGVLGYGRIGAVLAHYGTAFGMSVLAFGGAGSLERAAADGIEAARSQRDLFARADVLTVHLRLVAATRGIVTRDDLSAMSRSSTFVNASRAGLVAPGALLAALRSGRPGFAAVDVFDDEPLFGRTDELATMGNVVATPHLGYVTTEEWELQFTDVFAQVASYARGAPVNVVNPQVLTSGARR